jgi:hypothetical protein
MWTYLGKRVRQGSVFTDNTGKKYPPQWWSRTSTEDKISLGLVWVDEPTPYDNRFYWSADVPKSLEDIAEVDENGDPLLDNLGNQVITMGLKSQAIATVKQQAAGLLSPTDWYVTRKAETDTAIPEEVLTYREAVRTASGAIEDAITACTTHDAFMALYDAPVDEEGNVTGNAPINDWPESL